MIDDKPYRAHRLAWLFVYGRSPVGLIDHINMDRADNRISNLREASKSENGMNRAAPKNNKSGVKGVWFNSRSRKWVAEVISNKRKYSVGTFRSLNEASRSVAAFRESLHGKFARHV